MTRVSPENDIENPAEVSSEGSIDEAELTNRIRLILGVIAAGRGGSNSCMPMAAELNNC